MKYLWLLLLAAPVYADAPRFDANAVKALVEQNEALRSVNSDLVDEAEKWHDKYKELAGKIGTCT